MSGKVWLVTRGEYSDYSIQGVFSTEQKCLDYIVSQSKAYSSSDDLEVEEWPLDDAPVSQYEGQEWHSFDVLVDETGTAHCILQLMREKRGPYKPPAPPAAGCVRINAYSSAHARQKAEFEWRVKRANDARKVEDE